VDGAGGDGSNEDTTLPGPPDGSTWGCPAILLDEPPPAKADSSGPTSLPRRPSRAIPTPRMPIFASIASPLLSPRMAPKARFLLVLFGKTDNGETDCMSNSDLMQFACHRGPLFVFPSDSLASFGSF